MTSVAGVYKIHCLANNKVYVGKSRNCFKRQQAHCSALRRGDHVNLHLQRAWNLYGEDAFEFSVIEVCPDPIVRARREAEIARDLGALRKETGFNVKDPRSEGAEVEDPPIPDGVHLPPRHPKKSPTIRVPDPAVSPETRKRMSRARKGVPKSIDTKTRMGIVQDRRRDEAPFSWEQVKAVRLAYLNEEYQRPGGIALLARHLGLTYRVVYSIIKRVRWVRQRQEYPAPRRGGFLHVICGPMFSSKTSDLMRLIREASRSDAVVVVVKPARDGRYSETDVVSHDQRKVAAVPVLDSAGVRRVVQERKATVVGIDEVQFFDPGIVGVCQDLTALGIDVFAAGLDLDYRGQPFGSVATLLLVSDTFVKRKAFCTVCGEDASRSQRIVANREQVLVGGEGAYEARCKQHWSPEPVFSQMEHGASEDFDG